MNETKTYVCRVCGFVGRWLEETRHAHYKAQPPNCPSCHRVMEGFDESADTPTAKPRKAS